MTLRQHVAMEIKVLLTRREMSARQLAKRLGYGDDMALSRRLTGKTDFRLTELAAIADVLGVEIADLLPSRGRTLQENGATADRADATPEPPGLTAHVADGQRPAPTKAPAVQLPAAAPVGTHVRPTTRRAPAGPPSSTRRPRRIDMIGSPILHHAA